MNENLTSVAVFSNELEAEFAKATLEAAGIEAVIQSTDVGGMLPALQQTEGVRLLVDGEHAEEAKTLLSNPATEQSDG